MKSLLNIPEILKSDMKNRWNSFYHSIDQANIIFHKNAQLTLALKKAFLFSNFVLKTCSLYPDILFSLISSGDLQKKYKTGTYVDKLQASLSKVKEEKELMQDLRLFRQREMIRLAIRDLARWSELKETMTDLSALADASLDQTLSILYKWKREKFGRPLSKDGVEQNLIIFGMGKLGAMELNFSSDVDLIFAYPFDGKTQGGTKSITNNEFFTRLCQDLIKIMGTSTQQGFVFRVDTNLRPYGKSGPIVTNFKFLEDYLLRQGREWERYAWIKARAVGGDKKAGERLLKNLKPFVYRRYLDYGVFESLREMKANIAREVRRKGIENNIKLGPGGIREIEFFGQIFQLTRGGVLPDLQEPSILRVLSILALKKYIPQNVCNELSRSYIFLRDIENRLQFLNDQQTHSLPCDELEKARLAASMNFNDESQFYLLLKNQREDVHKHFNELLGKSNPKKKKKAVCSETRLSDLWQGVIKDDEAEAEILKWGFEKPSYVIGLLDNLRKDPKTLALSQEGRRRLDRLVPMLFKEIGKHEKTDLVLNRIVDLVKTIQQRTSYLSLLLENPDVISHLVKLVDACPLIASYLSRHPILLDELIDPRALYKPPIKSELENEIDTKLKAISSQDLEQQIETLCVFKLTNILRVVASDVSGALPIMKVSDRLSWIAEIVIKKTIELSMRYLTDKYGYPESSLNGKSLDQGFVIIGYGKLGGIELGYGSDLDLVFLHAAKPGKTTKTKQPIENAQFFFRLGQRIVHLLTTRTFAGVLYDVDMRLRPSGNSGMLVSSINGFEEYQMEKAWTWEHQAIVRARPICGNPLLAQYFNKIKQKVLFIPRDESLLKKEVKDIRKALLKEKTEHRKGLFHVKNDPGGIVDIEFLIQYLVLLLAPKHPELTTWTDNVRLIETLIKISVFTDHEALLLKKAYLTFRKVLHKQSLQEQSSLIPADLHGDLRKEIIDICDKFFFEHP